MIDLSTSINFAMANPRAAFSNSTVFNHSFRALTFQKMGQQCLKKSLVAFHAMPLVYFPPFMDVDLVGSWPLSPPANSSPINLTSMSSQLAREKKLN